MMMKLSLLILLILMSTIQAFPYAVGICYAGCAGMVTACFAAAGAVFGTVPGEIIDITPSLAYCNDAFSDCESACYEAYFAPRYCSYCWLCCECCY